MYVSRKILGVEHVKQLPHELSVRPGFGLEDTNILNIKVTESGNKLNKNNYYLIFASRKVFGHVHVGQLTRDLSFYVQLFIKQRDKVLLELK